MAKFKARARALDMLGRQQIAGIPTALNELFKNAHDAYADHVEVDFFRKHNLLLLRDDGIGMSRRDFEERWLTLGTESKLSSSGGIKPPPVKKGIKKIRPVMGEKGVGRLAIAAIGPQVLVLTRSEDSGSIMAAFINWGMFELPGIDLEEIEIPIKEFKSDADISKKEIQALVKSVKENLEAVSARTEKKLVTRIKNELEQFTPDIEALLQLKVGPNLKGKKTGTQFYISPVNEALIDDIDDSKKDKASNIEKHLLGFTNTLNSKEKAPLSANFRDHLENGQTVERAGYNEFFTQEEYDLADHHIQGEINSAGVFEGTISIYHGKKQKIKIDCLPDKDRFACGPFKVNIGYLQGTPSQSLVPQEKHTVLNNKLKKIGGLYIYRNGIRILPYGGPEFDFLGLEEERGKFASYLFTFRRLLGAVELTSSENSALEEKAGREGFQSNSAYRDFRDSLKNLFDALFMLYFSKDGEHAKEWDDKRKSLDKEAKAKKQRDEEVKEKRGELSQNLKSFSEDIQNEEYKRKTENLLERAENELKKILGGTFNEIAAKEIISLELELEHELKSLKDSYVIKRPESVGLTPTLETQWRNYKHTFEKIIEPTFQEAQKQLASIIEKYVVEAKVIIAAKERLQHMIEVEGQELSAEFEQEKEQIQNALNEVTNRINKAIKSAENKIVKLKAEMASEISAKDFSKMSSKQTESLRSKLREKVEITSANLNEEMNAIKASLLEISNDKPSHLSSKQAVAAMETELEMLREDYKSSLEMAQLGMAVSVIHHEFQSNVKSIRDSLSVLGKWAKKNESLGTLHEQLRNSFDHLDNYLNLFTPLDRRLRRRKTKITGESIEDFVKSLFEERMDRHHVKLKVTPKFRLQSISNYASTVYPAFINVIDNSFYWLALNDDDAELILDATDTGFSISDNGPGVEDFDADHIFDYGFTKKMGGRGMGLYIAKTALNEEGLDIRLNKKYKSGAQFVIEPIKGKKHD